MGFLENWNSKVATSPVGWWFRLDGSGHVRFVPLPHHPRDGSDSAPVGGFRKSGISNKRRCVAQRAQGVVLLHRDPRRPRRLLRHGVHHRREFVHRVRDGRHVRVQWRR